MPAGKPLTLLLKMRTVLHGSVTTSCYTVQNLIFSAILITKTDLVIKLVFKNLPSAVMSPHESTRQFHLLRCFSPKDPKTLHVKTVATPLLLSCSSQRNEPVKSRLNTVPMAANSVITSPTMKLLPPLYLLMPSLF